MIIVIDIQYLLRTVNIVHFQDHSVRQTDAAVLNVPCHVLSFVDVRRTVVKTNSIQKLWIWEMIVMMTALKIF